MVISTPRSFFQQELFESPDERHVSHWTPRDFRQLAACDYQNVAGGRIFLLSPAPIDVPGFGRSPIKQTSPHRPETVVNELTT